MPTVSRRDIEVRHEYDEDADISWMSEEELEDLRGGLIEIYYIWAEVQVVFKDAIQVFRSGGVGGVSVYVDDTKYLDAVGKEEVAALVDELKAAGIRVTR